MNQVFSRETLRNARKFYQVYQDRIPQTLFTEFVEEKSQTLFGKSEVQNLFRLSWSHYLILMRAKTSEERDFYEREAVEGNWSVRTLQRQYGSSLYERILISTDKDRVKSISEKGQLIEKPRDLVNDPKFAKNLAQEMVVGGFLKGVSLIPDNNAIDIKVNAVNFPTEEKLKAVAKNGAFLQKTDAAIKRLSEKEYTDKKEFVKDSAYAIFGQMYRLNNGGLPVDIKTGKEISLDQQAQNQKIHTNQKQSIHHTLGN